MRLYYLDKLGWPVETIKGRWFLNFLRRLIYTRKLTFRGPGRDTSDAGFHKLMDKLGILPIDEVKDFMQDVEEYQQNCSIQRNQTESSKGFIYSSYIPVFKTPIVVTSKDDLPERVPNALTRETIEKSERGEDVKEVDSVEELFEELDS